MNGLEARLVVRRGDFLLDVALTIPPDRTVAVLGPNGAGKTTLVEALAGLAPIDRGAIRLGDRILDDPAAGIFVKPADRRVGVVFQDGMLFPHLSALDNVAFGLRATGLSRSRARRRAASWLTAVGIDDLARRRPSALSGGQAQRVAFARALVTDPEVLLLDEPFSALDITARTGLRRMVGDHLSGYSGARLLITHDPAEAFLLADELVILEEGLVVQTGTADEIRLRPSTRYAADLAGVNLLVGSASGHVMVVDGQPLVIADGVEGRVIATIHPRAISIHLDRPGGSPRNSWATTIRYVDHHSDRVRIQTAGPIPLTAEVTPAAQYSLNLYPGTSVWLSVKATEINVARRGVRLER